MQMLRLHLVPPLVIYLFVIPLIWPPLLKGGMSYCLFAKTSISSFSMALKEFRVLIQDQHPFSLLSLML